MIEQEEVRARVERGGFYESVHYALAVVTDAGGDVALGFGDVATEVLPRSSNKPMQALAMLGAGAPLSGAHLAMACASHGGEDFHLKATLEILADAGLAETDLQNTPDWPLFEQARTQRARDGFGKTSLTQNCSGKHAAMLATCVHNGWPTGNYRDQSHPLQQAILTQLNQLDIQPKAIVVDGCGAPAHSMTLSALARVYGRFAAASEGDEKTIADAMREHPEYVAGTGRPNTDFMRLLPGAIAKDGAEGVLAVGLSDGRGVAIKVLDGNPRPRYPILGALLRSLHVGDEALWARLADEPILGHGQPVGSIHVDL